MHSVDRDSPVPAYYQIEMDLKARIARREWVPHQMLPSEAKLSEEYHVSRVTLRQALAELEKDGVIRKVRGRGAFINETPSPFLHSLNYSVISSDRMGQRLPGVAAKLLELKIFPKPNEDAREHLGIPADTGVVYIKRLFTKDDTPLAINRSWIPSHLVPGLCRDGLIGNQLATTLRERYGIQAERVRDYLEVVRPTPSECGLLEIPSDCPLILVKGVSYQADGSPLEYSNTLWPGDRVRFQIDLQNIGGDFIINATR